MTRILGISGSLRAGSYNTALLRAAQASCGAAFELTSATLHGIPLYDGDRPFALIGASAGGFGTILAQSGWLPVLRTLGVRHWTGGRLMVSRAAQVFDESGGLRDEAVRGQLAKFLNGFAAFAAERAAR